MSDISDANKAATIRFFMQGLNNQDMGVVADLLSPDYQFNGEASSVAGNQAWIASMHKDWPGLQFTIEAILAEDNLVALRWRMTTPATADKGSGYYTATNILSFVGGQALTNDQSPIQPVWNADS